MCVCKWLQVCELLEEHGEVFSTALAQSTPVSSEAKVGTHDIEAEYTYMYI